MHRRLIREALRQRGLLALAAGLGLAGGWLAIPQAGLFSQAVERAFLAGDSLSSLLPVMVGLLAIFGLRFGLAWGAEAAASWLAGAVKSDLRRRTLEALIRLGPGFTRRERTGELTNTLTEGIEALEAYYSQYLPQLILAVGLPLAILTAVFPIDPLSGVVMLATGPLIPLFMALIGSQSAVLTRRQWGALSRMSAYFLDVIQGLTTLKILGQSKQQAQVIAQVSERFRTATMAVLRVTFLSALALELLSTLSTAVVAVQIGLRLLYGQVDFYQAFLVLVLAPEFYLPLRQLGLRFHAGMNGTAAARRMYALLDEAAVLPDVALPEPQPGRLSSPPEISIIHASLVYPDGRVGLKDVTLKLPAGQVTALVGASGAGKSSLAGALLGFWRLSGGQVTCRGEGIGEIPAETWRRQIAWAPQNPYLFNESVLENLRLGNPQASLEAVQEAAQLAGAHEFIQALPMGYDTVIGERGLRLSGGQAQRLALGRAFLRDAPILILDEPSAHLDPHNEAKISAAVQALAQKRTVLLIAHRLHTIRQAQQLAVMQNGQVVQVGSPEELAGQPGQASQPGLLRKLLAAQRIDNVPGSPGGGTENPVNSLLERRVEGAAMEARRGAHDERRQEQPARPGLGASLRYLAGLLKPYALQVGLSVLLSLGAIAASVGLMTSAAWIITKAALQPSISELQVAIVGVRFFGLARSGLRYLERLASHQATFLLLSRLRVAFYQALEPLAPARLLHRRSGDLLAQMVSDIDGLENFYVRSAAPILTAALFIPAMGVFLGSFELRLGLGFVGMLLLAGGGLPLLAAWQDRRRGVALVAARARLNSLLVDSLQGLPDLCVYGQAEAHAAKAHAASQELISLQRKAGVQTGLLNALGGLLANLGLWGTLALAILAAERGALDGVWIGALALAALTSFEAVQPLPQAAQRLSSDLEAARRLLDVIHDPPEVRQPATPAPLPEDFTLQVEEVTLTYPQADDSTAQKPVTPPALQDVSFRLQTGQHIAIVGASGAGKTSLVNLLLRFWEPTQGQIRLGGVEIDQLDPDQLRGALGVVSQHTYLFSGTVRDNLLLANPAASREALDQACQAAQLQEWIESLPEGLETWIGENGLQLSAGERQRVALGRALLKAARLLILDEPAANLDSRTEKAVQQAVEGLLNRCGVLTITHRLSGLGRVDEILVLDQGKVVERGSFEALLKQRGLFWQMWKLEQDEF